ncbi:glycosyl transferase [Bacteroides caecigallinarum]|uniref:glycosyltransferase family 32 protein n=1 Tax=Bacteroides caecigallinarum TaxID=1411144 RepID=UPI001F42A8EA|nr:glycosyltransferase [Bacteroides caecigallinarum]MCF2593871.1 glycosyl transferase [Bacteroides caecigallinarum]
MIPKIIHYCWLSGEEIPEQLKSCMKSWKEKLPEYEFVLWDKSKFDVNSTLWTQQAYAAKKYAFAADYIRLYAVYNYGGIYMDMDVEVLKSFNHLTDRKYILGYEDNEGIEAGVFGAEKGAEWVKKCLDYYNGRSFIKNDDTLDTRPLPLIMKEIVTENFRDMVLLEQDFLTAKSYKTGKITVTKNTVTIHHFAGSWVTTKDKLKISIYNFIKSNKVLHKIYLMTYKKLKK